MGNDAQDRSRQGATPQAQGGQEQNQQGATPGNSQRDGIDGLKGKKPEELTPEELRLMADTMPGEGPGD